MSKPTKSFLGVDVYGTISHNHDTTKQKTLKEFAPLLQAVLDQPLIARFGWWQYTPYFNDGDPCTFSAHSAWFLTTADIDNLQHDLMGDFELDEDDYEVNGVYAHPTLGRVEPKRIYGDDGYEDNPRAGEYVGEHPEAFAAASELNCAVEGRAFHTVLLEAFGDHVSVEFRRGEDGSFKAYVNEYSHD